MSLQIWLPLNKDLRNVGLNNDIPITTVGDASFIDNISPSGNKAALLRSNTGRIQLNNFAITMRNASELSICIFAYTYVSTNQLIFSLWRNYFAFALWNNAFWLRTASTGDNGTGQKLTDIPSIEPNKWTHYACTFNRGTTKIYINGEFYTSGKTVDNDVMLSTLDKFYIGNYTSPYFYSGCTCDFRAYDNELSEKDIKRIYQQKLFEFYPKECKGNLISFKNINGTNGWSSFGFGSYGIPTVVNDITPPQTTHFENIKNNLNDNVIRIDSKYTGTTTATTEIANSINIAQYNVQSGDSVTFSFYAKGYGDSIGRTVRAHIHASQSENTSVTANQGTYITLTSGWTRNVNSFVWKKDGKIGNFHFYIVSHMKKEEHIYVSNFQIEIGSASDYSNSTQRKIIFDKSGFLVKNDLVCSGVTFSGNSAVFNGSSDIIRSKTAGLNISGGTLSIWFLPRTKPSGNGTVMFLDGNSRMSVGLYNNAASFIVSTKTSSQLFPASSVIYGQWNHICVLYGADRVAYDCYLNGVKLTPSSTTINWSETEYVMKIGARENYNSYFDGSIKNIKIFKKQLSEEEILELYRQNGN